MPRPYGNIFVLLNFYVNVIMYTSTYFFKNTNYYEYDLISTIEIFMKEARDLIGGIMDPDRDVDETGFSGNKISGSESHLPTDVTDNSESEHEKVPYPQ